MLFCIGAAVGLAGSAVGDSLSSSLGLGGFFAPSTARVAQDLPPEKLGPPPAAPPPSPPVTRHYVPDRAHARDLLIAASRRQGLNPNFVLAVAWWESGWDQAEVSPTGAVGLMQIEPQTAAGAGPALLGRSVDIRDPADNALLGAALLHQYLLEFRDGRLALAAYYQGEPATRAQGILAGSRDYVDGIWQLFRWLQAGNSLPVS